MGEKAHTFVRDHFLLTRHLAEYLNLMVILNNENADRVEL
jgi:hypothetical protein